MAAMCGGACFAAQVPTIITSVINVLAIAFVRRLEPRLEPSPSRSASVCYSRAWAPTHASGTQLTRLGTAAQAWYVQKIISAFYSALRGGRLGGERSASI